MKYFIFKKKEKDQFPFVFEIKEKTFCSDIIRAKRFTFDEAVKFHLDHKEYEIIQETRKYDSIDFKINTSFI
jgi:hypothetical protein